MGQTNSRLQILDTKSQNVKRFGKSNGFSFKGLSLVKSTFIFIVYQTYLQGFQAQLY